MTTDPLTPPAAAPTPTPTPAPAPEPGGRKKIVCSFCKCELTQSGDYFVMSDEAKAYRDALDQNAKLQERVRVLEGENQALKVQPAKPERKSTYPF